MTLFEFVVGSLCSYTETEEMVEEREKCKTRKQYLKHLKDAKPSCEGANVGMLTWKPDDNTANQVYYQVKVVVQVDIRITVYLN